MSHRIAVMSFVLVVLSATAVLVVGCGGGAHTSAEAHLAAVANAACREGAAGREPTGQTAKVRALMLADRKLPRVSTFISDSAALGKLAGNVVREVSPITGADVPHDSLLLEESTRLKHKLEADLKALGWTSCLHEISAHGSSTSVANNGEPVTPAEVAEGLRGERIRRQRVIAARCRQTSAGHWTCAVHFTHGATGTVIAVWYGRERSLGLSLASEHPASR